MGDVIVVSQYNINLNILYDLTYFLKPALKEKQNTKYQSWYVRTLWVMDSFVFWVVFFFSCENVSTISRFFSTNTYHLCSKMKIYKYIIAMMFAGRYMRTYRSRNFSRLLMRGLEEKYQVSGNMVEQLEGSSSSEHQRKSF